MDIEKKPVVSDVAAWAMNSISSVGIIMANKQLISPNGYAFWYATTLAGFHFCVTALVGWISNATFLTSGSFFGSPLLRINLSITGMNLSLMLNSVGFYQISKRSIIPVVGFMEFPLHRNYCSSTVILAVAVVAVGVGICTVTDVDINAKGLLWACVAVFCTSLQQIFFILLSRALAVFCSMSQYLCIGRFSATSFQVLGHMKTVCQLILGWIFFDSSLTLKNVLGMLFAVLGMVVSSWTVESEKQAKLPTHINADSKLAGGDVMLLKEKVNGLPEANIESGKSKS